MTSSHELHVGIGIYSSIVTAPTRLS